MSTNPRTRYGPKFHTFMKFIYRKNGRLDEFLQLPRDYVFPREELLQITDLDVASFLACMAFGSDNPAPGTLARVRHGTLQGYKTAISTFMPRDTPWDSVSQQGNPALSRAVRTVIDRVERAQTHGDGIASKARRPIEFQEFVSIFVAARLLYAAAHQKLCYLVTAVVAIQWHIIGRIDDTMRLTFSSIAHCPTFSYALKLRLSASKNIRREQQVTDQIILGSNNPLLCVLLNLAAYVELVLDAAADKDHTNIFGGGGNNNCEIRKFRAALEKIFKHPAFRWVSGLSNMLGTHSLRKGPATFLSRLGFAKDWVSNRGRWAGMKRAVDVYIAAILPYPDARCAEGLCGPEGAVMYDPIIHVPIGFLEQIAPNAASLFPDPKVAHVLALPLIWAAWNNEYDTESGEVLLLPVEFAASIRRRWTALTGSTDCPVEKKRLLVGGVGDQLYISPLRTISTEAAAAAGEDVSGDGHIHTAPVGNVNGPGVGSQQVRHDHLAMEQLFSQQFALQQRLEDINKEMGIRFNEIKERDRNLMTCIRRIAIQPVVRQVQTNRLAGAPQPSNVADLPPPRPTKLKLVKTPKNLSVLWKEYEFGFQPTKPAKEWSAHERAGNSTYSRRLCFWQAMEQLMKRDHTMDTAIDKIYKHYGGNVDLPVNKILLKLRADRKAKAAPFFDHLA